MNPSKRQGAGMAHVEHKKVDLVELFFDLVMVYAISQTTGLIHHLHAGVVDPWSLVSFALAYVILVNAWMYQVVYTNRFGKTSARDIAFSLVSMALLLFLSSTISADWRETFRPFSVTLGLLFLVQMVQYGLSHARESGHDARFLIRGFLLLTGIYALTLLLGAVLPYDIGVYFTMAGLVSNITLPLFFMRRLNHIPLNFPHLVERLSLLVIITFGEMIIGVAPWFTVETLSFMSVLVFCVCAALFVHYIWVFDRMIDLDVGDQGAYKMQYAHIPIFLGLGMVTVSFSFITEADASMPFVVGFLYTGLFLFYLGLGGSNSYRQPRFRASRRQLALQGAGFVIALALCLALADVRWAVLLVTDLLVAGESLTMWVLYRRGLREGI